MQIDASRNCLSGYTLKRKSAQSTVSASINFAQDLASRPKDPNTNQAPYISGANVNAISVSGSVVIQNIVIGGSSATQVSFQVTGGDPVTGEIATVSIQLQLSDGTDDVFWLPLLID